MQRILILSCSERKRSEPGLLPAIERYDGPVFRVLRRYLRDHSLGLPEVHILSAKFGLISSDHLIPDYDCRMTVVRARELRMSVQDTVSRILDRFNSESPTPDQLLLCLGRNYRETLAGYDGPAASVLPDRCVRAGLGRRLTLLRNWLYELDETDLEKMK